MKNKIILIVILVTILMSCESKTVVVDEEGNVIQNLDHANRRTIRSNAGYMYAIEVIDKHEYFVRVSQGGYAFMAHSGSCVECSKEK